MTGYRGDDRRRSTALVPEIDALRLGCSAFAICFVGVVGMAFVGTYQGPVSNELATAVAAVAATLLGCVAIACALLYRISRDQRAVHVSGIAVLVGAGTLVSATVSHHSAAWAAAAAIATITATWNFAALVTVPEVDTTTAWWKLVTPPFVAFALTFVVCGLLWQVSLTSARAIELVGWVVCLAWAGLRLGETPRHLQAWLGLFGLGVILAAAIDLPSTPASTLLSTIEITLIAALSLIGVMIEVRRAYAAQQRGLVTALADTAMATMRAQSIDETREERLHEARAALAGIGAAAVSIARYRDLLEPHQFDELSDGLVHEVSRLRTLIEDDAIESVDDAADGAVDVAAALTPVVACARAMGMQVRFDADPNVVAASSARVVAQVATELISNAERHAPGSVVEVAAISRGDEVWITVSDRGPGIDPQSCERIFERGVSTGGTGLGLYVVRSQLTPIGGRISAMPRYGGGAKFIVRLPAAASETPGSPSTDARSLIG